MSMKTASPVASYRNVPENLLPAQERVQTGQVALRTAETITSINPINGAEGQILVSACGRTCNIARVGSMLELQSALQQSLRMEDQNFHICDVNGSLLTSDVQIQEAISRGLTPFSATLTDKALHSIENRREELAQMQWKLIRDQMTSATNQNSQLARQVNELQFHLQGQQRELQSSIELVREDLYKALENERAAFKNEMQALSDQVTAAVMMVNSERNKRELSVQGFEKHLHGVCDMLDGERSSRRQDMAMHMTILQELRTKIESEKHERESIEDKIRESQNKSQQARDDLSAKFQNQVDNLIRVKGESEVSFADVRTRFQEIEDRCATIEGHMAEASSWHSQNLERIGERHEGVSQKVEVMRLDSETSKNSVKTLIERLQELDHAFKNADNEQREMVMKERELRDDHVRRTQNSLLAAQCTQITELEKRLNSKLQIESGEREKNFQWIIDQVTSMILERKDLKIPNLTFGRPPESEKNAGQSISTRAPDVGFHEKVPSLVPPYSSDATATVVDETVLSSPVVGTIVSSPLTGQLNSQYNLTASQSSLHSGRVSLGGTLTRSVGERSADFARSVSPNSRRVIPTTPTQSQSLMAVPGLSTSHGMSLSLSAASLPLASGGAGSASYPSAASPRPLSAATTMPQVHVRAPTPQGQMRAPTPQGSRPIQVGRTIQTPINQTPIQTAMPTPRSASARFTC